MITKREAELLKRCNALVGKLVEFRALFDNFDLDCSEVPPGRKPAGACAKKPCWQCRARKLIGAKT